jgi:hypothetical protein
MNFSLAENPELIIGAALVLCVTLFISIKFIRNRNINVNADNGSAAVNGENKGNITINQNKEK